MEILAFTLVAVNHETPHDRHYCPIDRSSIRLPHLPNGQWIGLTTTALSLAIVMAAPGAMALVRLGDTGDEVTSLQTELQSAGYAVGGVDGIFGAGTEAALIQFQTQNGLVADGIAGPSTLAKLQEVNSVSIASSTSASPSMLTLGASGEDVTALQTKLKQLGFFPSETNITGYYGEVTVEAVRRFQQANSLGADGIAGPATQAKLFGDNPVSQEVAQSPDAAADTTSTSTTSASQMLAFGQQNDEVVKLQDRLKQLGYLSTDIASTGYFGSLTLDAVKEFQTNNELAVDGLVGSRTLSILNSDTAIAASPSEPEQVAEQTATSQSGGASVAETAVGGPASTVDELPPITEGKTITIRTNGDRLNVRSAPNVTSSTIKGSLANGASVEATGSETEGWVEIVDGWISKEYIEIPQ